MLILALHSLSKIIGFVRHGVLKYTPELIGGQKFRLSKDDVIGVEAFVINADLLHFVLVEVDLNVLLRLEYLVAHRATRYLLKPVVDAFVVENMEAAQDTAL